MSKTIFKTIGRHKEGTVIEVRGEHFTFDKHTGFGMLETESPAVIDRLRDIPEGFVELPVPEADGGRAAPALAAAPPKPADPLPTAEVKKPEQEPEGSQKPANKGTQQASPFVLAAGDGSTLDLATLDDAALREFVVTNSLKVHGRAKGDTLRQAIVDAINATAA